MVSGLLAQEKKKNLISDSRQIFCFVNVAMEILLLFCVFANRWEVNTSHFMVDKSVFSSLTCIIFPPRTWKITMMCKSVNQIGKICNLLVFLKYQYHHPLLIRRKKKKKKPFLSLPFQENLYFKLL